MKPVIKVIVTGFVTILVTSFCAGLSFLLSAQLPMISYQGQMLLSAMPLIAYLSGCSARWLWNDGVRIQVIILAVAFLLAIGIEIKTYSFADPITILIISIAISFFCGFLFWHVWMKNKEKIFI